MMKVQLLLLIELFVSCSEFSDKISMTYEVAEHINLLKASIVSNEGRTINCLFLQSLRSLKTMDAIIGHQFRLTMMNISLWSFMFLRQCLWMCLILSGK